MSIWGWIFAMVGMLAPAAACAGVTRESWGTSRDGQLIFLYTLRDGDFTVKVTNYGARVVSIVTPDRNGKLGDMVLGYDSFAEYESDQLYMGAVAGRYCNRIANGSVCTERQAVRAAAQ
jgi:aldose 1-epimerase